MTGQTKRCMKKVKYILLIFTFLMIAAGVVNGQHVSVNADTSAFRTQQDDAQKQKQEKTQTQTQSQSQTQAQDKTQSRAQSQKGNATGVKQVSSARPDWSKARGARPASVERPSGSRIPKGVGKPHGANGPGGR
jgi:cytoskeletal protein RodZ